MVEENIPAYNFEVLDALVKRVFRIEKFQNGTPNSGLSCTIPAGDRRRQRCSLRSAGS
jgi:hypothetical protein